jgi:phosphatidylinositol glycan class M
VTNVTWVMSIWTSDQCDLSNVNLNIIFFSFFRYGWDFLYQTYLYHLVRRDIRHNFSVYFYMLYLTEMSDYRTIIGLLSFLPQLLLMVMFSIRYRQDTALCWFLNTFVFVTFNKVCTSQVRLISFCWYII